MSATLHTYPAAALLIDGEWIPAGKRECLQVHNPATGERLGEVPVATLNDIDAAVNAAQRAFAPWSRRTALERSGILRRIGELVRMNIDRLSVVLTLEQGKTLRESVGELTATADTFDWMAEEGKRVYGRIVPSRFAGLEQFVVYEPVGVVAALSPWNYPAALGARKVATALAAGCTVVLKPAEETPGIWVALAELCIEAGLPKGVLNMLYGKPAEISERLLSSPQVKKLSFTGSVPVGLLLAQKAAATLKRLTLELGGHSPVFVCEDTNVQRVAELAVASKFRNAGQICHSPTRFFVHRKVHAAFADAFASGAGALKVGNGLDADVQMGPLANRRRQTAMESLVGDAEQSGARVLVGGRRGDENGNFWLPTVVDSPSPSARILSEEPFGPLAVLIPYDDIEEAVVRANAVEYGLGSFAFTASLATAQFLQSHVKAGSVSINTFAITPPEVPFGGIKLSGYGSEMGSEGLLEHFNVKTVIRATAP